ncbi:MAG: EH signature domain-containing protein [Bacteriovoracia bacterium]
MHLEFRDLCSRGKLFPEFPANLKRYLHLYFCYDSGGFNISRDQSVCDQVFQYIETQKDFRLARKLAMAMLKEYDLKNPEFYVYLDYLKRLLSESRAASVTRLLKRDEDFKILSPSGPDIIVKSILESSESVSILRDRIGISGDLGRVGLGLHVVDKFSTMVTEDLKAGRFNSLSRYFNLVTDSGKLFAPERSGVIGTTLLSPFLNNDPSEDIKSKLIVFFDTYFGDPRTKNELWLKIDPGLKKVILRWKVGLTLKAFFGIIEYAAKTDKDADRMWKYRKIFWNAYLEEKHIVEAWVLLGTVAYEGRNNYIEKGIPFGRVKGGQPNHSAILMKIGSLTICEWSHSGAIRIWEEGNPKAPSLYNDSYHKDELIKGADVDVAHFGSEVSRWQDTIAEAIYDLIRVRVDKWKYFKK